MTIVEMRQNMKLKEFIHSAIKEGGCGIIITNPRSQGCPRFQSGEELANNVGKINAHYSL